MQTHNQAKFQITVVSASLPPVYMPSIPSDTQLRGLKRHKFLIYGPSLHGNFGDKCKVAGKSAVVSPKVNLAIASIDTRHILIRDWNNWPQLINRGCSTKWSSFYTQLNHLFPCYKEQVVDPTDFSTLIISIKQTSCLKVSFFLSHFQLLV